MAVAAVGHLGGEDALSATYKTLVNDAQQDEEEFKVKLSFQEFDVVQLEVRP